MRKRRPRTATDWKRSLCRRAAALAPSRVLLCPNAGASCGPRACGLRPLPAGLIQSRATILRQQKGAPNPGGIPKTRAASPAGSTPSCLPGTDWVSSRFPNSPHPRQAPGLPRVSQAQAGKQTFHRSWTVCKWERECSGGSEGGGVIAAVRGCLLPHSRVREPAPSKMLLC